MYRTKVLTKIQMFKKFKGEIKLKSGYIRTMSNFVNRKKDFDFSSESKYARSIFPSLVEDILKEQLIYHKGIEGLRERYTDLLYSTCFLDDLYLPYLLLGLHAYKMFEKPSRLNEENLRKSAILSWLCRMNTAAIIISDDIIDNSSVRYNRPTWFMSPGNNFKTATCDVYFLITSVFYLLLNNFSTHRQYFNIQKEIIKDYSTCMMDVYLEISRFKSNDDKIQERFIKTYPVTTPYIMNAMYLANVTDERLHSVARNFLHQLAEYVKKEDDFIGVFGSSEKQCTDASEGLPTWLAVQVFERGTEDQKIIFKENYRKDDKESLKNIYELYKEMQLEERFHQYQEDFYETMYKRVQDMPKELPGQLFLDMLDYAMLGRFQA